MGGDGFLTLAKKRGRGNDFSVVKLLRLAQSFGCEVQLVPQQSRPTLTEVLAQTRAAANTGPDSR